MTNFIAMFFVVVKNYKGLEDEVTDFAEQGELRRARGNFAEQGGTSPSGEPQELSSEITNGTVIPHLLKFC